MNRYDADGRDPGLAAERTDLAWNRSGLSLLALGAAIMRGTDRPPLTSSNVAVGMYVFMLGTFVWFLGAWHSHGARHRSARRARAGDLAPLAFGIAAVGLAAFVLGAVAPS